MEWTEEKPQVNQLSPSPTDLNLSAGISSFVFHLTPGSSYTIWETRGLFT